MSVKIHGKDIIVPYGAKKVAWTPTVHGTSTVSPVLEHCSAYDFGAFKVVNFYGTVKGDSNGWIEIEIPFTAKETAGVTVTVTMGTMTTKNNLYITKGTSFITGGGYSQSANTSIIFTAIII